MDQKRGRGSGGCHPAPDDAVHDPLRDAADGVQPDSDAEAVIVLLPGADACIDPRADASIRPYKAAAKIIKK